MDLKLGNQNGIAGTGTASLFDIHPVSDPGQNTAASSGFIVDAEAGSTLFVFEDPKPGEYTVTPAVESVALTGVGAPVTPEMVTIIAVDGYGQTIGFFMALLKAVSETDARSKTHTLHVPGPRSETVAFTPQDRDFDGAPCVKLVDSESYARFEADGDLFVSLRILNESETAMTKAPVRIYYNHRTEKNLLAEAQTTQEAMSYSDVHFTIAFENMVDLQTPADESATIVYDIETDDQEEHLTYDNAGVMAVENTADFRAAKEAFFETAILLNLDRGWNLVGDAVREQDIFRELTHGTIYSHDGSDMRKDVQNTDRGGGYFVYLPRDTNIALTGTPIAPDFSGAGDNKWELMGTGVDIYNTLSDDYEISFDAMTYTPGKQCDCVYALERGDDGEAKWEKNPAIIEAGSGFWCVKEQ
ncbi:MAG: hypothetical protein ACQERN_05645 [Thermodesulfobacteriota bacterium]